MVSDWLNVFCAHRKLEQEHKEKLGAVRSQLLTELDQIQQQAVLQKDELEAEVEKTRADESFMRDHLSVSIKVRRPPPSPDIDHLHHQT